MIHHSLISGLYCFKYLATSTDWIQLAGGVWSFHLDLGREKSRPGVVFGINYTVVSVAVIRLIVGLGCVFIYSICLLFGILVGALHLIYVWLRK